MKYILIFLCCINIAWAFEDTMPTYNMYSQDLRDAYAEYLHQEEQKVVDAMLSSFQSKGLVYVVIHDSVDTEFAGWRYSDWLGYFYQSSNLWIYHPKLKWIYPYSTSRGYWLWLEPVGWIWTSRDDYPFFCDNFGRKLYLYDTEDRTVFYCYDRDILINP
jgi:hypothetical protein